METIEDRRFDKEDFSKNMLPTGVYDNCVFNACNFEKAILSNCQFCDCNFTDCNLSMTDLGSAVLNDVRFVDCKMMGIHFDRCSEFIFLTAYKGCNLNHSSFYARKLKKTIFDNCTLQNADFTGSDLTSAIFNQCDLLNTKFENTVLEKADLRTSFNFAINPDQNRMKKAKFSLQGLPGLLHRYDLNIEE